MLKAYELYSYWITVYFIIYLFIIKYNIDVPSWINPYPTIMFMLITQTFITGVSIYNNLPLYFIIGVVIWKLIILHLTLRYIKKDFTLKTVIFNLILLILYLVILKINNKNVFSIYFTVMTDKTYFDNFFNKRIKNII